MEQSKIIDTLETYQDHGHDEELRNGREVKIDT